MLRPAQRPPLTSRSAISEAGAAPPARAPGLRAALVRRLIGLVLSSPPLKRLALRVALHFPALLLRFKSQIKDVMVTADPAPAEPVVPPPSAPVSMLGPRFEAMILDEMQRLGAAAGKESGGCG